MKPGETGGCPMHAGLKDPTIYGQSDLTYNDYLKVPEMLELQIPQSNPKHHDELLFIVIHQAYELWFKLILHELETAIEFLQKGEPLRAHHFTSRVTEIMKLLVRQIHILETMTPVDFLAFRDRLKPASGFQSLQFREIEFVAGLKDRKYLMYFQNRPEMIEALERRLAGPDLRSTFYEMLRKRGFAIPKDASERELEDTSIKNAILQALLPIYEHPSQHLELYLFTESLVDFDQCLGLWREHHVRVVERIIGAKTGTGGSSGIEYLRATTARKCFPMLWEVRTLLEKSGSEAHVP